MIQVEENGFALRNLRFGVYLLFTVAFAASDMFCIQIVRNTKTESVKINWSVGETMVFPR